MFEISHDILSAFFGGVSSGIFISLVCAAIAAWLEKKR